VQAHGERFERVPMGRHWARLLWGAPVDGRYRTNASWCRRGDRAVYVLDGLRPPGRWSYLPQLARAGVVWALAGTCLLTLWAMVGGHTAVLVGITWVLRLSAFGPGVLTGWQLAERARTWRVHRDVIRPLHHAIHELIGRPELAAARPYIHLPEDWAEPDGSPIVVDLPRTFVATDATNDNTHVRLCTAASAKLGLAVDATWKISSRDHHVMLRPRAQAPRLVSLADPKVRRMVEAAVEAAPLLGLGAGWRVVAFDLDSEASHLLVSCASGGGKTTFLRVVLSQVLHHGALATVLDFKRFKFSWARGIPGVDLVVDVPVMHDALVALGVEVERRIHLLDEHGGEPDEPLFPRHILILDEGNTVADVLRAHWQRTRSRTDPTTSPALTALERLTLLGRELRIHVVAVYQHANVRAVGTSAAREQYGCRIVGRHTPQLWRMVGGDLPMPPKSMHRGRAYVVMGSEVIPTQMLLMEPDECRAWATSGTRPVDHLGTPAVLAGQTGHSSGSDDLGETGPNEAQRPALYAVPNPNDDPVTLIEALGLGLAGPTIKALRDARHQDRAFPASIGRRGREYLYRRSDLQLWAAARPRAGRGGDGA